MKKNLNRYPIFCFWFCILFYLCGCDSGYHYEVPDEYLLDFQIGQELVYQYPNGIKTFFLDTITINTYDIQSTRYGNPYDLFDYNDYHFENADTSVSENNRIRIDYHSNVYIYWDSISYNSEKYLLNKFDSINLNKTYYDILELSNYQNEGKVMFSYRFGVLAIYNKEDTIRLVSY